MNSTFPLLSHNGLAKYTHASELPLVSGFSRTTPRTFQEELTDDIVNPRVKELILSHKNLKGLLKDSENLQIQRQNLEEIKNNQIFLKQFQERRWLTKKGKKYLIDFDNQERRQMKQYFNSLDDKKCGSIGIDELEQLLLSVGLFETREEIKALIDSVDEDKSGKIEFGQFLSMIQNDEGQNEEIVSFFKSVIGGSVKPIPKPEPLPRKPFSRINTKHPKSGISEILQKHPYPKGLSFQMVVSHIRRKHMMTALNIGKYTRKIDPLSESNASQNTYEQVVKGQRVMQALQKMYERKLIREIKQSKRNSQLVSDQNLFKKTNLQPWFTGKKN